MADDPINGKCGSNSRKFAVSLIHLIDILVFILARSFLSSRLVGVFHPPRFPRFQPLSKSLLRRKIPVEPLRKPLRKRIYLRVWSHFQTNRVTFLEL